MFYIGLDLCRERVDVCVLDEEAQRVAQLRSPVDEAGLRAFGIRTLTGLCGGVPPRAAVESMTGSRLVRDVLVEVGWQVQIADAVKVKGIAPLACKTDKIDSWVLARLCQLDLVPAIWLPPMGVRADRERVRFRAHLVKHRTMLKNRVHSAMIAFGKPGVASDQFGIAGRKQLAGLELPPVWASSVAAEIALIDYFDTKILAIDKELGKIARRDPVVNRLQTVPGVGLVLGSTIAAEIGDISRFPAPSKLISYSGLVPRVYQSGSTDRRGHLTKAGPRLLRWAMVEAAVHASAHPAYHARYQATAARIGKDRGRKIARIQLARDLLETIWWMLTRDQDFAPAGAKNDLAA